MNKHQEALNKIVESCCPNCHDDKGCSSCSIEKICNCTAKDWVNTLQELVDKHEKIEQENFDLRNKLNTEEECCVMVEKKVKQQVEIIKSLCKALEGNGIDLSYLMFSYLTPEEWQYCKELLEDE